MVPVGSLQHSYSITNVAMLVSFPGMSHTKIHFCSNRSLSSRRTYHPSALSIIFLIPRREFKRSGHQMTPAMAESPAFVRMSTRTIPTAIFMLPHHLPPASERLH